jgi:hypothetical protein
MPPMMKMRRTTSASCSLITWSTAIPFRSQSADRHSFDPGTAIATSCVSGKQEVSMNKIVIVSSVVASAALVGCRSDPVAPAPAPIVVTPPPAVVTTPPPAVVTTPPPAVVVSATPVRPGFGRVESIAAAPPSASAAAGGTTMRRLSIKMEDGTLQLVDTVAGNIAIGDRVELTSDGKIRR